jgi:hypothetical protein
MFKSWEKEGRPLAVCINDCQLDFGQPKSELRRTCFNLGCAFAELRWGQAARPEPAETIQLLGLIRSQQTA